jgi:hypothetical protein
VKVTACHAAFFLTLAGCGNFGVFVNDDGSLTSIPASIENYCRVLTQDFFELEVLFESLRELRHNGVSRADALVVTFEVLRGPELFGSICAGENECERCALAIVDAVY